MYSPLIALVVIATSFAAGATLALAFGLPIGAVFLAGALTAVIVPAAVAARYFVRSDW